MPPQAKDPRVVIKKSHRVRWGQIPTYLQSRRKKKKSKPVFTLGMENSITRQRGRIDLSVAAQRTWGQNWVKQGRETTEEGKRGQTQNIHLYTGYKGGHRGRAKVTLAEAGTERRLKGKTGGVRTWDIGQGGYEVEEHGWSRLRVDIRSDREGTGLCDGQQVLERYL